MKFYTTGMVQTNFKKGYTIVEIMVAITIFVVIIAAPIGFLISTLKAQQKILFSQELLDNTSYAIEYMSRALRMAKKDVNQTCIGKNENYQITRAGTGIKFLNYNNYCQEFYLETGVLKEYNGGRIPNTLSLSSSNTNVLNFKIVSWGWSQADLLQPKVTLYYEAERSIAGRPELKPLIKIQTTISQRDMDINIQ